jgi:hypothetical protein
LHAQQSVPAVRYLQVGEAGSEVVPADGSRAQLPDIPPVRQPTKCRRRITILALSAQAYRDPACYETDAI